MLRRIWAGPSIDSYYLTPSPDGRLVSFADWSTGDLVIRELATGEIRHVTNEGDWGERSGFAEFSVFSPDGRQIAYTWCCDPGYQLRVSNVDGSELRVLYDWDGDLGYIVPGSWSADGKNILTSFVRDAGIELVLVSVADGSAHVLRRDLRSLPVKAGFSPDGRYAAYDQPAAEEGIGQHDVFSLAVESGREVRVVGGPGNDLFVGWAPDGSRIYFHSDASGAPSIWAVPMSEGEASGAPELIKQDVEGLEPVGVGGGKFFYSIVVERPQVHTMTLDIPTGQTLAAAMPEAGPSEGRSGLGAWSADGRYLAYVHSPATIGPTQANLVIRAVSGNNLRQLPIPELSRFPDWLQWAPDGESILVSGGTGGKDGRTLRIPLKSGEADPLLEVQVHRGSLSRDGEALYTVLGATSARGVVSVELASGNETVLYKKRDFPEQPVATDDPDVFVADLSLSPDGHTLAIGFNGGIALMPTTGGELRWIYRGELATATWRGGMPWTPDGRYILFVSGFSELWALPVSGGEPHKLFEMSNLREVRLHPDGRRLSFTGGQSWAELWVMENAPGSGPRR
ncbi:MAG: PD40 domain-containing protein [Gemmatimonadota bacterium]|nr:MAG: PD40 domain-containing protein [Gemmatimonadota bacterium]